MIQRADAPVYLTTAEVARLMKVSRDTVQGWILHGYLPAVEVNVQGGKRAGKKHHFRVAQGDLETFIATRRTAGRCWARSTPRAARGPYRQLV